TVEGTTAHVVILQSRDNEFGGVLGSTEMDVVSEATATCTAVGGLGGRAIFGGGPESCGNVVDISGSTAVVDGGVHSNGDFKTTGSTHIYEEHVSASGEIKAPTAVFNGGSSEDAETESYPVPEIWLDVDYWRNRADRTLPPGA